MLNILAQYKLPSGLLGPLGIHREIEALKHVVAVRTNLGDPDFYNVTEVLSDMLSPKFAEQLKKTINDNKTFHPSHYGGRSVLLHGFAVSISFISSYKCKHFQVLPRRSKQDLLSLLSSFELSLLVTYILFVTDGIQSMTMEPVICL